MTQESQSCLETPTKDLHSCAIGSTNIKHDAENNNNVGTPNNVCSTRSTTSRQAKAIYNNSVALDVTTQVSVVNTLSSLSDSEAKKCGVGPTLRSSARVPKRPKDLDSSVSEGGGSGPNKKTATGCSKSDNRLEQAKTRRTWEVWSVEDKNSFFDALCEYGKDFENIQNYIVQKTRKKGHPSPIIKNKDQVRHFYYRTWHKISTHLNIDNDIKKQVQELYGLINYGELRKKIGGRLDEKNGQKLNELVHNGVTVVRCKGKNVRIKTPVCRALKRLNDVEGSKDGENVKLPNRITLELRPRNNHSWSRVQSISQNPRIRMDVSLQCRLSVILRHLKERWRLPAFKLRDELLQQTSDSDGCQEQKQQNMSENQCQLKLFPQRGDQINPVCVKPHVEVSNLNVSLQNYRFKKGLHIVNSTKITTDTTVAGCSKKGLKSKNKVALASKVIASDDRLINDPDIYTVTDNSDREVKVVNEASNSLPAHEVTMRQLLALETASVEPVTPSFLKDYPMSPTSPIVVAIETTKVDGCRKDIAVEDPVNKTVFIKPGWSSSTCNTLTIGEVYLMLGRPQKLVLEYQWESDVSSFLRPPDSSITSVLSRLLHLATANYSDLYKTKGLSPNMSCRCGHVCPVSSVSSPTKTNAGFRGNSKIPKCGLIKPADSACGLNATTTTTTLNTGGVCADDVFRKPSNVQTRSTPKILTPNEKYVPCDKVVKEQLDKYAQNRKTKGRLKKTVVVQRELPLLPKTEPNQSMMTLRFVHTASQLTGSFMPVMSASHLSPGIRMHLTKQMLPKSTTVAPTITTVGNAFVGSAVTIAGNLTSGSSVHRPSVVVVGDTSPIFLKQTAPLITNDVNLNQKTTEAGPSTSCIPNPVMSSLVSKDSEGSLMSNVPVSTVTSSEATIPRISISESGSTSTMSISPLNISSLLDISLPGTEAIGGSAGAAADKLLDITLGNSTSDFSGLISMTSLGEGANLNKSNGGGGVCSLDSRPVTPVNSPTNSLFKFSSPGLEGHSWLNGDASDFSLTNFLSHLESPIKTPANAIQNSLAAQPQINISTELLSNFHGLMNENCIDFTSKFEDLAARK